MGTFLVMAAVHRGFGSRFPCHQVTNFLDLPALGMHHLVFEALAVIIRVF